jgi:hypothetical protein
VTGLLRSYLYKIQNMEAARKLSYFTFDIDNQINHWRWTCQIMEMDN